MAIRGFHRAALLLAAAATVAQLGCVGIGGETIRLDHDPLAGGVAPDSAGFVSLVQPAQDVRADRSRIGRATITLFAITSGAIRTSGPVGDEVARNVQDALAAAGYRVLMGSREQLLGGEGPARPSASVVVTVDELYFRNYNWLWPFVPTWGDVRLTIEVWTPENDRIFRRTVSGSGRSYRITGHSAFTKATTNAMTEALNQLVSVVSQEEFRLAAIHSEEEEEARTRPESEEVLRQSAMERLLELKGLLDDGIISEKEYERTRQELLDDL